MSRIPAWSVSHPRGPLSAGEVLLDALSPREVEIEVSHCGLCRSDLHLIDGDWGKANFPLVPGHEIVGTLARTGAAVHGLELGQRMGVGWQSHACLACPACLAGRHNLCRKQRQTCVGRPGGFASRVRVQQTFAHPIPEALASEHAAPLLCAGATVYAPLRRFDVGPRSRVGVIGLGGLGHLGLAFARVLGAEVTVFSSSANKRELAVELGAHAALEASDEGVLRGLRGRFDLLLSTAPAKLPWTRYVQALAPRGALCFLATPPEHLSLPAGLLVEGERSVTGGMVASPGVIREMLEVAARHGVQPLIECMAMGEAQAGIERLRRGEARFRVVLVR